MMELSPEIVAVLMLGGVLIGILTGYHLAIPIGAIAFFVGYFTFGPAVADILYNRLFALLHMYPIIAVPLFIYMGCTLERTGIAERLYSTLYLWLGRVRGGLGLVTILLGTILAACVGIIGASVSMLSLAALPSMIKRGYDKSLAAGTVCAGGVLGILIPPSIMLVVYGPMAEISVGKLFMAAFPVGLMLSCLYMSYIGFRCWFKPETGPAVPAEETAVPFLKKTTMLLINLVPTAAIVLAVLGTIFLGIAPPTEAAGVGAFAATLLAIVYRRFNLKVLSESVLETLRITSMILLIGGMSFAFTGVFLGAGGGKVVEHFILSAPFGRWGAFATTMLIVFMLGMFIDWLGIVFIMVPILSPLAPALSFDPLWFAMMIIVNLQMSFMTPPFATAIFYVKASALPELGITLGDIIYGVIPFVILIMVGIVLCVVFPEIVLWLPSMMIR